MPGLMLTGLYGLGSLSGAPLRATDAAAIGLDPPHPLFAALAFDPDAPAMESTQVADGDDRLLLLGRLDGVAALAAALERPVGPPAEMVLAALRRWGIDARENLLGEWSLAWWQGTTRTLTLGVSHDLRDPLLFARNQDHVAFAADIRLLARLDWVNGAIDPEGFAYAVGRAPLRLARDGRTILRDVTALGPGTWVTIGPSGCHFAPPAPLRPTNWSGGFGDAVADLEEVLRQSVRRAIVGRRRIGVLLSGGLDSSLLAAIAAEELGAGQSLTCFTSAAPAGSGLVDELHWSRLVADAHGLEVVGVCPGSDPSVYLPSAATFALHGPLPSPRHYLYEAFAQAGRDAGIEVMLDGLGGESTITSKLRTLRWQTLRGIPRQATRRLLGRMPRPEDAFHPKLAMGFVATLPRHMREHLVPAAPLFPPIGGALFDSRRHPRQLHEATTAVSGGGYRQVLPFRDRALLRLAAAMPARFADWQGVPRAIARNMLIGKVPDAVRSRPTGLPISPDYRLRLRDDAPLLAAHVQRWRDQAIGDVVDLDWLDVAASNRAAAAEASVVHDARVSATSYAAGFLAGWSR